MPQTEIHATPPLYVKSRSKTQLQKIKGGLKGELKGLGSIYCYVEPCLLWIKGIKGARYIAQLIYYRHCASRENDTLNIFQAVIDSMVVAH
jgi:hypothetical protein